LPSFLRTETVHARRPVSKGGLRATFQTAASEIEHGGFYQPVPEFPGLERTVEQRLREAISLRDFGALGDGSGDTVREWLVNGARSRSYRSVQDVKVDYPHCTGLENTIDEVCFVAAWNWCVRAGRTLWIPDGEFLFTHSVAVGLAIPPGADSVIVGAGPLSVLRRKPLSVAGEWQTMLGFTIHNGAGGRSLPLLPGRPDA
jgi:hypothetical protein